MDTELIAAICGCCSKAASGHHIPTVCFTCAARYDLGAPIALVEVEIGVTERINVRYVGSWTAERLAVVRQLVEGQHGPSGRTPSPLGAGARAARTR
jgi:hypothetical protein